MFVLAISGFARMEVQRVLKRNITKFIGAVLHFFDLKACSNWKDVNYCSLILHVS